MTRQEWKTLSRTMRAAISRATDAYLLEYAQDGARRFVVQFSRTPGGCAVDMWPESEAEYPAARSCASLLKWAGFYRLGRADWTDSTTARSPRAVRQCVAEARRCRLEAIATL